MQDLQEVTQEVHYENYRSERLAKATRSTNGKAATNGNGHLAKEEVFDDDASEKDRILKEKEAELKRMQEILAQMQAKIQAQSN
jgi:septin 2